jgi:hypothetical protein
LSAFVVPTERKRGPGPITPALKIQTNRGYGSPAYAGTTNERLCKKINLAQVAGSTEATW